NIFNLTNLSDTIQNIWLPLIIPISANSQVHFFGMSISFISFRNSQNCIRWTFYTNDFVKQQNEYFSYIYIFIYIKKLLILILFKKVSLIYKIRSGLSFIQIIL